MARAIDPANPFHIKAAAIYDTEGLDACMLYLHLQVRLRHICAAQAAHILCWTVPDDVLDADMAARQKGGPDA